MKINLVLCIIIASYQTSFQKFNGGVVKYPFNEFIVFLCKIIIVFSFFPVCNCEELSLFSDDYRYFGAEWNFGADSYDYLFEIGHPGSDPTGMFMPSGLAEGAGGTIYVNDSKNGRINSFFRDGSHAGLVAQLDPKDELFGITISQGEKALVLSRRKSLIISVQLMNNGQNRTVEIGSGQGHGLGMGSYFSDLKADLNGTIWVTDALSHRITGFEKTGKQLRIIGEKGSGDGQLNRPKGMAIGPDGSLYISDSGNRRISVFSRDGNFEREFIPKGRKLFIPGAITVDPYDNIYVNDDASGQIIKMDKKGQIITFISNDNIGFLNSNAIAEKEDDAVKDISGGKNNGDTDDSSENNDAITNEINGEDDAGSDDKVSIENKASNEGSGDKKKHGKIPDMKNIIFPSSILVTAEGRLLIGDLANHRIVVFGAEHFQRGCAALLNENFKEARRLLEIATKVNPNNKNAFYYLGLCCEKTNDFQAALQAYQESYRLQPGGQAGTLSWDRIKMIKTM